MAKPVVTHVDRPLLGLLFRIKMRSLRNRIHQTIQQGPLRVMATSALMLVVWFGLYMLFHLTFSQLRRTPLQATKSSKSTAKMVGSELVRRNCQKLLSPRAEATVRSAAKKTTPSTANEMPKTAKVPHPTVSSGGCIRE